MLDPVKNFALVEVSKGYNASATTVVLSSGEGAKLPAPATDGEFNLVWWNATDYPNPSDDPNKEIVRVTARTTNTLTVTRAQEGTTSTTKNAAGSTYKMALSLTKKTIDDIDEALANMYPVGSIYINATNATNPGTLLGFGTWVAFGAGRVMVGLDSGDTDFDTAEETGGAKTHTLTEAEMPSHDHSLANQTLYRHSFGSGSENLTSAGSYNVGAQNNTGSAGSGNAHNNVQPYITVYMWKRTA